MTNEQRDYMVLERQYASVCSVCNAQSAELRALHAQLQSLADVSLLAANELNVPTLGQHHLDILRRMRHEVTQARRLIRGEA